DSDDRTLIAHQVRNAAFSVLPRFYHVYLTDDPTMIKNIARFRELPPNADVKRMLDATIHEMKKRSPQGPDLGPDENPNGEPKNGMDTKTP
ncbi:MAG TPA: YhcN/YlaJ family sporulation lipoprotein, partial [Bacillales bacterium]|nr:YhcN/YlaJ family sporulation lipoprotein [Bacillales bacterium]